MAEHDVTAFFIQSGYYVGASEREAYEYVEQLRSDCQLSVADEGETGLVLHFAVDEVTGSVVHRGELVRFEMHSAPHIAHRGRIRDIRIGVRFAVILHLHVRIQCNQRGVRKRGNDPCQFCWRVPRHLDFRSFGVHHVDVFRVRRSTMFKGDSFEAFELYSATRLPVILHLCGAVAEGV